MLAGLARGLIIRRASDMGTEVSLNRSFWFNQFEQFIVDLLPRLVEIDTRDAHGVPLELESVTKRTDRFRIQEHTGNVQLGVLELAVHDVGVELIEVFCFKALRFAIVGKCFVIELAV